MVRLNATEINCRSPTLFGHTGKENAEVESVAWNGERVVGTEIAFADLAAGGVLEFQMVPSSE